jgi:hypothetical protein
MFPNPVARPIFTVDNQTFGCMLFASGLPHQFLLPHRQTNGPE